MALHGHGLRARQVRGPTEPDGEPGLVTIRLRRYRCVACSATVTVAPAALLPRRLYSACAIAAALALWAVSTLSAAVVRRRISPWRVVGPTSAATWAALRDWVASGASLFRDVRPWPDDWPPRRIAERIAVSVAALVPGRAPIPERAFHGAARSH